MSSLPGIAAQFVVCSLVIMWSGVRLSRYGDMIAEKTGLGGTWVGLLLMAAVTSLPELVTGGSAVLVYHVTDIAAGDAIGSCMFNLVILALLDFPDSEPLTTRVHQGHVLTAAFGILQLGLVGLAILAGSRAPMIGWVGVHSILFIALYLLAMRTIFVFERHRLAAVSRELAEQEQYAEVDLRRAVALYAGTASVLVAAAVYLPGLGDALAKASGLSESFVGSLFVAASTSLPEIMVSIGAVRMGAVDMAAANLFGSNLFNVAILGIDDLLYRRGSMLAAVSMSHVATLLTAIMMTAVATAGLTYRAAKKRYYLSWDAIAIVLLYVIGVALMHLLG
ncbi:MAG: sodium:calcium antiporter [Betaproteobacteria bacterium]